MNNKPDTRKTLVNEALKMFLTRGYDATSINDISMKCGVTKGAFYHYFKSKDQLFRDVIEQISEEYEEFFIREIMSKESFEDFFFAYFSIISYHDKMSSHMGIDMNMVDLVFDGIKKLPDLRKSIAAIYTGLKDVMITRINSAREDGEIDPSVDPESLALEIIILIEGMILFEVLLQDENPAAGKTDIIAGKIWERIKKS